ncbi:MAG: NAD(P)/FAD-dependent oxidoreductase [Solirubrobacteraceae bacterium]
MGPGVVIAGAGLAAQRCCAALRTRGWDGPITLVGDEPHAPYDRPPLSKAVLAGDAAPASTALRPRAWYDEHAVQLRLGTAATGLDPATRTLLLADGARLPYEHLVVATGGAPVVLPALRGRDGVRVLRTLDDALALRAALEPGVRLGVVGAGLVGLEVAATARRAGAVVTVVEAAPAPLAAVLGTRIGGWLTALHTRAGVEIACGAPLEALHTRAGAHELVLADGRRVACDVVLAAVGMRPATGWLAGCGLGPGAIATDAAGRTALPGVYAAGDAAGAGHWEAAARQGAAVAAAILGQAPAPAAVPSFWSDQHGVRLQFAGNASGHDRVAVDGDPAAGDARALYLRDGRPIGGLLLGRPRALPALRRLLSEAAAGDPRAERTAA